MKHLFSWLALFVVLCALGLIVAKFYDPIIGAIITYYSGLIAGKRVHL